MLPEFSQLSDAPGLMQTNCQCMVGGAFRILQGKVIQSDRFLQSKDSGVSRFQVAHFQPPNNRLYPLWGEAPSSECSVFLGIDRLSRVIPLKQPDKERCYDDGGALSQLIHWMAKSVLSL